MSYRVTRAATVEVPNLHSLLAAWKTYGGPGTLVGRFVVRKPLTASQLRRLPRGLKAQLK